VTIQRYKTKSVLLLAVSLSLLACETAQTTTKPLDASPPAAEVQAPPPAPREPIVVRSDIVPDDPEPVAATPVASPKPARRVVASAVVPDEVAAPDPVAAVEAAPARPDPVTPPTPAPEVNKPVVPEPAPAATATPAAPSTPATPAAPAAPTVTADASSPSPEPAAEAPPTAITPPPAVETPAATPSTEPPPSSILNNPSEWLKDPGALLQASIGGVPLWLVVLLAVLAIISLLVGFGRSKDKPEKEEPAAA
jgi:hypothetical protein